MCCELGLRADRVAVFHGEWCQGETGKLETMTHPSDRATSAAATTNSFAMSIRLRKRPLARIVHRAAWRPVRQGARGTRRRRDRAANLLQRYGSLEAALAAGRFPAMADSLRLYRSIATMNKRAPLPSLRNQTPTWHKAAAPTILLDIAVTNEAELTFVHALSLRTPEVIAFAPSADAILQVIEVAVDRHRAGNKWM